MDNVYDDYGVVLKPWFAAQGSESKNSYHVNVLGWRYPRRIMFRDGLISFQVTVCGNSCWTCKERVCFVKERVDELNAVDLSQVKSKLLPVQSFWTYEFGSFYITFSPPRKHMSGKMYLSLLLGLLLYTRQGKRKPRVRKTSLNA
jgi:hypothetical protein